MIQHRKTLTVAVAGLSLIGLSAWIEPPPRLIWNASASVPIGFYAVAPIEHPRIGDIVAVTPPEPLAAFFAARGYLPVGVPLLKPVAALPGQRVCRLDLRVTIDGRFAAMALPRDRRGAPLPVWQGCRQVAPGQVFLLNSRHADSLDGRYFGPLAVSTVIGRATPVLGMPEQ